MRKRSLAVACGSLNVCRYQEVDLQISAVLGLCALQTGSSISVVGQANVNITANQANGVMADNGAGVTLVNSVITGNVGADVQLTFGTRADLSTLTFGTYACDATVLVRGSSPASS